MSAQPETPSALSPAGREPLEAILLVGGQGTRLRPLTIGTPKPLLPTAGVPFLAHQFAKAAAAGIPDASRPCFTAVSERRSALMNL